MRKRILRVVGGALIGLALVLGASTAASGGVTAQITDNSTDDHGPAISGSNLVWWDEAGSSSEIYFSDGVTITQLTDNGTGDYEPAISGSKVVWWGRDGSVDNDGEIYFWDGVSITQLTDNGTDLPLVLVPVSILLPWQFSAQSPEVLEADSRVHCAA